MRRRSAATGFACCLAAVTVALAQDPNGSSGAGPADLGEAVLETRADIQRAARALTELRALHAEERKPLAERLASLRTEVKALR